MLLPPNETLWATMDFHPSCDEPFTDYFWARRGKGALFLLLI
jgi:hypothetical protein